MEAKHNTMTVCKGEFFEISLMSNAGSTGFDWCLAEMSGPVLFADVYNQEVGPKGQAMAGKPHKKVFAFIAQETGEAKLVFKLLRGWAPDEVISAQIYTVKVEASHTQDELKEFVNANKFPKTPILKYGFIPTDTHQLPRTFYGYLPPNVQANSAQPVYPLYGMRCADTATPLMPYGVYGANGQQDLRVVEVPENDSRCILKYGSPDPYNVSNQENCRLKYGFVLDMNQVK